MAAAQQIFIEDWLAQAIAKVSTLRPGDAFQCQWKNTLASENSARKFEVQRSAYIWIHVEYIYIYNIIYIWKYHRNCKTISQEAEEQLARWTWNAGMPTQIPQPRQILRTHNSRPELAPSAPYSKNLHDATWDMFIIVFLDVPSRSCALFFRSARGDWKPDSWCQTCFMTFNSKEMEDHRSLEAEGLLRILGGQLL
jgi:hypothetical protein